MSEVGARRFSRAFKLKAIERMEAGENVSALSRELEGKRTLLYRWRSQHRAGGAERFRERRGRPAGGGAGAGAATRSGAGGGATLGAARRHLPRAGGKGGRPAAGPAFFFTAFWAFGPAP